MSADVFERIKMIIDIKEYYIQQHNELVYLFDPAFLTKPYLSDEYLALKYCLIALDLNRTKSNFRLPHFFQKVASQAEIEQGLKLFNQPIAKYAKKSLSYSCLYKEQLSSALVLLETFVSD